MSKQVEYSQFADRVMQVETTMYLVNFQMHQSTARDALAFAIYSLAEHILDNKDEYKLPIDANGDTSDVNFYRLVKDLTKVRDQIKLSPFSVLEEPYPGEHLVSNEHRRNDKDALIAFYREQYKPMKHLIYNYGTFRGYWI